MTPTLPSPTATHVRISSRWSPSNHVWPDDDMERIQAVLLGRGRRRLRDWVHAALGLGFVALGMLAARWWG